MSVRLLVLATVWLLASGTISLAQEEPATTGEATTPETSGPAVGEELTPTVLIVPDVRDLPYVFAKGTLEDAGFAWRVDGKVEGYAVNLVAKQSVEPGTKVVNTGAPTVVLNLKLNPDYQEVGLPDDASPYPGTKIQVADGSETATAEPATEEDSTGDDTADVTQDGGSAAAGATEPDTESAPAPTTDAEPAAETVEPAAESTDGQAQPDAGEPESETRPPAFAEPGAPPEPLDEMSLPRRARLLGEWLDRQDAMGPAAWDHYAYQHAWVVTGARFGWWRGAEALEILIGVDERLQKRFDIGSRLEREARAALEDVLRKAREP